MIHRKNSSIRENLKLRIKACMSDRLEIMSRYHVFSLDEFEKKMREGVIPEYPGWEDLITLENLETSVNKLRKKLLYVGNISKSRTASREFKKLF